MDVVDRRNASQARTFARGFDLVETKGAGSYAHVLVLRLDFLVSEWDAGLCFLDAGHPLDHLALGRSGNRDQMSYLPGACGGSVRGAALGPRGSAAGTYLACAPQSCRATAQTRTQRPGQATRR